MHARYTIFLATMTVMLAGSGCTTSPTLDDPSNGLALGASPRLVIAQRAASPPAEPYPYFVLCDPRAGCPEPTGHIRVRDERKSAAAHPMRAGMEKPRYSNIGSGTDAAPLYTAHFAFDRATLSEGDRAGLGRLAVELLSTPQPLRIRVQGYTDNVGGRYYNARLAFRRAEAVWEYLVAQGLDAGALTLEGFGRCCYVASNQTARGRSANRRAEVFRSGVNEQGTASSQ